MFRSIIHTVHVTGDFFSVGVNIYYFIVFHMSERKLTFFVCIAKYIHPQGDHQMYTQADIFMCDSLCMDNQFRITNILFLS